MDYKKQGEDFLLETDVKMEVEHIGNDFYFDGDKDKRDIYRVTFKRKDRSFSIRFGQSMVKSKPTEEELYRASDYGSTFYSKKYLAVKNRKEVPTAYDVLSCLEKHHPGSFGNFCCEYGYEEDSRKAFKIYQEVLEQWEKVSSLWTEAELEKMQEIQ